MDFSIVVPLYRCSNFIVELSKRLITLLEKQSKNFEIIFVNDASPENDWELVSELSNNDIRIKGINFSRNFGQHYAITAGIEHAKGEWIVVMDGDLQDKPEEILKLYNKTQEGYHIVLARRKTRKDGYFKRIGSKYFYRVLAFLTDTEQNEQVANFGIYHRKVILAIISMKDYTKYFPAMVRWVGFKRIEINVEHAERKDGKSGYSFRKLVRLALNVILSFSDKPLKLTVKFGLLMSGLAFAFALFTFYRAISGQIEIMGYSSLIISVWFLSGVIITFIGMLGLYIGRIFEQVKDRPRYLISETLNI